jgi:hypothetical protein
MDRNISKEAAEAFKQWRLGLDETVEQKSYEEERYADAPALKPIIQPPQFHTEHMTKKQPRKQRARRHSH